MGRTFIGRRISGIAALAVAVGTLLVLVGGIAPAHAAVDDAEITPQFFCDGVSVTSTKDISNIVVRFADGSTERFEGLSGHEWSREFDREVDGVWVKSGNNKSGDGPGYGEWIASDADCTDAQPSADEEQPAPEREPAPEAEGAPDEEQDKERGPKAVSDAPAAPAAPAPAAPVADVAADVDVRPVPEDAPEADDVVAPAPDAPSAPDTAVLGITVERPVTAAGPEAEVAALRHEAAPAELATTGIDAGWLLALAAALAVYGIIALDLTGRRVEGS